MIQINDEIKCQICGKKAMGLVGTTFLCGGCIVDWDRRKREKEYNENIKIFEEMENDKNL